MAENVKFTKQEIENAIDVFKKLSILFEENNELFLEFKSKPIRFLRESGLAIMKYINNQNQDFFLNRFSYGLRNILRFKDFFDRCSWCKIMALTIIYALCGKARLTIDAFWGLLSSIIEAIESILNISNEMARNLLNYLNSINDRLSPFGLARLICEQSGHC
ncbi:hypothetical protein Belba_2548 [Belliella baltica DSM 15883]|uniref:Uncharacterized protein n=1 Tax=Belliella baltica (strain DSM 15883 / CIP 108006 / LMG 21964 / BA134) TaxID=866536 RepID=I3Z783_BELBD|nr:hypothetical protein [Belliella baltica]AFL85101.1 hypothetical protein Belba_2548 [Belliella baltica DSM 15883]